MNLQVFDAFFFFANQRLFCEGCSLKPKPTNVENLCFEILQKIFEKVLLTLQRQSVNYLTKQLFLNF